MKAIYAFGFIVVTAMAQFVTATANADDYNDGYHSGYDQNYSNQSSHQSYEYTRGQQDGEYERSRQSNGQ